MFVITAHCDICFAKQDIYRGTNLLLTHPTIKNLLKEQNWMFKDGKEFCPKCTANLAKFEQRINRE